ncbi:MAG: hypothetical protein GXO66_01620 [Euryarchaeota archaeon]|nr:hypothetical protein [Euryarchaeota archaeon]
MRESEALEEIARALASLSDDEREALLELLRRVAQNAEEIERALKLLIALADLVEELKPLLGEVYAELREALELAEGVDFGELIEQLKAHLDGGYQSSR